MATEKDPGMQQIDFDVDTAYSAIAQAVQNMRSEIEYLKKDSNAPNYSYLSDQHMTNVLRPLAVKHGLIMSPAYQPAPSTVLMANNLGKNSNMHMITWSQSFGLIHAPSGQRWPWLITVQAQGVDSGDKAANKGLTAAHRYAWVRLLFLETGDDPEGDRNADDLGATPKPDAQRSQSPGSTPPPDDEYEEQGDPELDAWVKQVGASYELKRDDMKRWEIWKLCFGASQKRYGKMERDDNRKMEPMRLFEALEGLDRSNPFQAQHVAKFRSYCATGYPMQQH